MQAYSQSAKPGVSIKPTPAISHEDMINGGRQAFLSAPNLQGMLEGGVAIWHEAHCIGAVGVSGVKAEEDAELARLVVDALLRQAIDNLGVHTSAGELQPSSGSNSQNSH